MAAAAESDSDPEEVTSIVLDSGSGRLNAGFGGDDLPRLTMPALIGRLGSAQNAQDRRTLFGDDVLDIGPVPRMALSQPVQRGIVTDWDDAELLWRHAIEEGLRADPQRHPVLLAEPPLNPKCHRETAVQVLFESIGSPAVYIANASSLAMYASGRGSAVMLNCGEGVSHAEVIYEGYAIHASARRLDCAGADVTDAVRDVLRRRGCCLETPLERQLAARLKERHFRVRRTGQAGTEEDGEEEFELPDGRGLIKLSQRDRTEPWELLLGRNSSKRLQRLVDEAIQAADIDVRSHMWRNVIVSGGSTFADGFEERLTAELAALAPVGAHPVKLVAPFDRKFSTWIGGSILASLSTFQTRWISRSDYEEFGPCAVHRLCN